MITALLDPCVVPPFVPPVVESLAATGSDGALLTVAMVGAVVLVAAGAFAMLKAKTLRGKIAAFVLPAVLLGSLAFNAPAPAFAAAGAPTVATAGRISASYNSVTDEVTVTETTAVAFANPEGCGVISYQWQSQANIGDAWVNSGAALTSAEPLVTAPCIGFATRLLTTLSNNTGSVTSASNEEALCL
jgi:hypothetical protein